MLHPEGITESFRPGVVRYTFLLLFAGVSQETQQKGLGADQIIPDLIPSRLP